MAVDTILLSFCEDAERNGNSAKYAPKLLMDAIGKGHEAQNRKVKSDSQVNMAPSAQQVG